MVELAEGCCSALQVPWLHELAQGESAAVYKGQGGQSKIDSDEIETDLTCSGATCGVRRSGTEQRRWFSGGQPWWSSGCGVDRTCRGCRVELKEGNPLISACVLGWRSAEIAADWFCAGKADLLA